MSTRQQEEEEEELKAPINLLPGFAAGKKKAAITIKYRRNSPKGTHLLRT